jgi:diguanylate cyclase (GGDEF)-like protein
MTGGSRGVVVVLLDGLDPGQRALVRGVSQVLSPQGYAVLAHAHRPRRPQVPPHLVRVMTHLEPRGVITAPGASRVAEQGVRELLDMLGIPVVHLAQDLPGRTCVRADVQQGVRALLAHLLDECGVRSPVLLTDPGRQSEGREWQRVFREELTRRGLPVDESRVVAYPDEGRSLPGVMGRLLSGRRDLDAVVATNDTHALAVLDHLVESGVRVPADVRVTGCDNAPDGALAWPGLTTLDQDPTGQGATAARILLDLVDGAPPGAHTHVRCRVVRRGTTTADPATADPTTADPAAPDADPTGSGRERALARRLRAELRFAATVRRMTRELSRCWTVEQVAQAVARHLAGLDVGRCFLVVFGRPMAPHPQGDTENRPDTPPHGDFRLVLDFRDGTAHPVSQQSFTPGRMLPDHLQEELTRGYLGFVPLATPRTALGYLLLDHDLDSPVAEVLRSEVRRSLDVIRESRELRAQVEVLEDQLDHRTQELRAEAALRQRTSQELRRVEAELEKFRGTDVLNRIIGRSAFDRRLADRWREHLDSGQELAVLMVDVDLLKSYNERYGHLRGDDVLRTVASCLERAVSREEDLVCRYGGEEFAVLLPGSGRQAARAVARRFRKLLAQEALPHETSTVAQVVTASVGVAVVTPSDATDVAGLLEASVQALAQAKDQGRDRAAVAGTVRPSRVVPRPRRLTAAARVRDPGRSRRADVVPGGRID